MLEPLRNENVERVIRSHHLTNNGPTVGVNVQDLLFWRNESKKVLADTLDTLSTEKGATIIFLPFGSYKDGWFNKEKSSAVDMAASEKLAALMKGRYSIITDELTPQELLAVIEKLDLVVSMRLHGLIMGLNAGVPVIALTYEQESKIRNLMCSDIDVLSLSMAAEPFIDWLGWEKSAVCEIRKNFITWVRAEATGGAMTSGYVSDPCGDSNEADWGTCDFLLEGFGRLRRHTPTRDITKVGLRLCEMQPRYRLDGTQIVDDLEFDMRIVVEQSCKTSIASSSPATTR